MTHLKWGKRANFAVILAIFSAAGNSWADELPQADEELSQANNNYYKALSAHPGLDAKGRAQLESQIVAPAAAQRDQALQKDYEAALKHYGLKPGILPDKPDSTKDAGKKVLGNASPADSLPGGPSLRKRAPAASPGGGEEPAVTVGTGTGVEDTLHFGKLRTAPAASSPANASPVNSTPVLQTP